MGARTGVAAGRPPTPSTSVPRRAGSGAREDADDGGRHVEERGRLREGVGAGANVNLPFANFGAKIQGTFDGDGDQFDAGRHALVPRVSAGAGLRQAFRAGLPVEKVAAERPAPSILHYRDVNAAEVDGALTPGGVGEITGSRLGFTADDSDQGVFYVADADGAATRADVVALNAPSKLIVQAPAALGAGDYHVEVRAAFGDDLRTGRLDTLLTVA